MRLDQLITPEALTLTIGGLSRVDIEMAIERLIEVLDSGDAPSTDLEPDVETIGDDLPGDVTDAEADQPIALLRVGHRLRR